MTARVGRDAVRTAVQRLERLLEPLARRPTVRAVHDARAAARRLGDTLSTFDAELPVTRAMAGWLKDACGEVRDLHVSGARRGPRLTAAVRALREAIADWHRARPLVTRELATWVPAGSPQKLLRRRLRRLRRRLDRLPARVPPRQAHRLRVKTRRARTAIGLVERDKKRLRAKLKQAAKLLGKVHDLDAGLSTGGRTRQQWLAELGPVLESLRGAL